MSVRSLPWLAAAAFVALALYAVIAQDGRAQGLGGPPPALPYVCTSAGCVSLVGAPGAAGPTGPPGPAGPKGDPGSVSLSGSAVSLVISQRLYVAWGVQPDASPALGAQFGSYTITPPAEGLGIIYMVCNAGMEMGEGRDYDVIGASVAPRQQWKGPVDIRWTGK